MMTTTMTNDEVIRMAKEAGLHKMIRHNWKVEVHTETLSPKLERFAALVAGAKDKEIAAKQAEIDRLMWEYCPHQMTINQASRFFESLGIEP